METRKEVERTEEETNQQARSNKKVKGDFGVDQKMDIEGTENKPKVENLESSKP